MTVGLLVPGSPSAALSPTAVVTRFRVPDAEANRERLAALGVTVEPLEHVPGAVDYFDFADLDGNRLSLYSLISD